ncbi:MAG: MBL fold metallo-hydrolase [Thermodesulfobacteriota bacterium]|nr:MBL fold metallo-hydrolase [Thermodesulfobacteriota bacterium]
MQIEIIGTESLGVRGLCTVVTVKDRKIVIDPGVALGYTRRGKLPHPFQVFVGAKIRDKIIESLKGATDVVFSHYHGDHVPLVDANPYQLDVRLIIDACRDTRFWCKAPDYPLDRISMRYNDLSRALSLTLPVVEGKGRGLMTFSGPQPHGEKGNGLGTVMMTRIEDGHNVFVHASDIQLLGDGAVSQVLDWKPSVVLVSGPPLYLRHLTSEQKEKARRNAIRLGRNVDTLIIDHHLLRSEKGCRWLDGLASEAGSGIMCAADFMGCRRLFLESWRERLYREMPVPEGWHEAYAQGDVDIDEYEYLSKNMSTF